MKIETWSRLPAAVRDHLVERMHDRNIGLEDLGQIEVCRKRHSVAKGKAVAPQAYDAKHERTYGPKCVST